jgi:aryl-alcohol dehydrogenase-like predicted oxidoreductase
MKLALGTVQFGVNYGVANVNGKTSDADIKEILRIASTSGINTLDTAVAYGDSEKRLGTVGVKNWNVITKLPEVPSGVTDIKKWIFKGIQGSLDRLRIDCLEGVLLHQPYQMTSKNGDLIYGLLQELVAEGLVKKIGISVYTPKELEEILPRYDFNIVQAPFNIIDFRLIRTGWMKKLYEQKIELHVRSIFLQGLLLMNAQNRPIKFQRWSNLWSEWEQWINDLKITPLQACLSYVLSFEEINKVLIGADTPEHLKEILGPMNEVTIKIPESFKLSDPNLLNPSQWFKLN